MIELVDFYYFSMELVDFYFSRSNNELSPTSSSLTGQRSVYPQNYQFVIVSSRSPSQPNSLMSLAVAHNLHKSQYGRFNEVTYTLYVALIYIYTRVNTRCRAGALFEV